jgi:uncharacterized membrane protein
MIVTEDLVFGLILGASLVLLSFSIASFRRSGLKGLRIMMLGLALQSALTVVLLAINLQTDWLAQYDWWVIPFLDVMVLVLVLIASTLAGRAHERPT